MSEELEALETPSEVDFSGSVPNPYVGKVCRRVTMNSGEIASAAPQPQADSADEREGEGTASQPHARPLLDLDGQIAKLKEKGIAFELCSEDDARMHLASKCQFFRIYAYRKNFDKHEGGVLDGQYVALDFAQLKLLSNIDRTLRDALLPMTLDVEHFAKVRLLDSAAANGEDGYAVMRDYLASVGDGQRAHIERELDQRKSSPYCGDIVRKSRDDMPLWAFCEAVSFGAFLGILKFCAERWDDEELLRIHYCLRLSKSVRNACAHGSCIVNDLSKKEPRSWRTPDVVTRALAACGVGRRLRAKRLGSPRMAEMCTLIYIFDRTVPKGTVRSAREKALTDLFCHFRDEVTVIPAENPVAASMAFLERLTRGLGLIK